MGRKSLTWLNLGYLKKRPLKKNYVCCHMFRFYWNLACFSPVTLKSFWSGWVIYYASWIRRQALRSLSHVLVGWSTLPVTTLIVRWRQWVRLLQWSSPLMKLWNRCPVLNHSALKVWLTFTYVPTWWYGDGAGNTVELRRTLASSP